MADIKYFTVPLIFIFLADYFKANEVNTNGRKGFAGRCVR